MARHTDNPPQPFLKWAGGKRQLLPGMRPHLEIIEREGLKYYEPFLGGGAVLFDRRPGAAVVNDFNPEIINAYETIRDQVGPLIADLKKHRNEAEYYYRIRELDRSPRFARLSRVRRASRILYLNKTCYNGLFRVNSQGQFNVPFGRYKHPNIVNEAGLRAVSAYLKTAKIEFRCGDFEAALQGISRKSFVYLDPPYHPLSGTSSFTGYAMGGFGEAEQIRLKQVCDRLHKLGCRFLLSNSYSDFIVDLYKDYPNRKTIQATRSINSVASSRGKIPEILIWNYD